ncbi:MAG: response regulator [Acidobacteriota bacterium]|nr:response regulator [Acidobacteriota bacterium]
MSVTDKSNEGRNTRILIVDDHQAIHTDFRKILVEHETEEERRLGEMAGMLFGPENRPMESPINYELDSAFQGEEALQQIEKAHNENKPYSVIFMDINMPPGLDGVQTTKKIWENWPDPEIVLVSAYADYSWEDIHQLLGDTDRLLYLRKPFDVTTVKQMASSLTLKWTRENSCLCGAE